jgi:hypothetical protein
MGLMSKGVLCAVLVRAWKSWRLGLGLSRGLARLAVWPPPPRPSSGVQILGRTLKADCLSSAELKDFGA